MGKISQYIENEYRSTQNTSTTDELILVQGDRISETPEEYIARKYGIRGDDLGIKGTLREDA